MRDHRTAEVVCPTCGCLLGAAFNVVGIGAPEDGDMTVCGDCFALLVYCGTPVDGLRLPTAQEHAKAMASPEFQSLMMTLAIVGPQPRESR